MPGLGPRRPVPPCTGTRRTRPHRTGSSRTRRTRPSPRTRTGLAPRFRRALDALADQAPAEHPVQGAGDLFGQISTAARTVQAGPGARARLTVQARPGRAGLIPGGRTGRVVRQARLASTFRRHDRPAVPALDLTQPLDQVHARAPGAPVQLRGPVGRVLASGADKNLALPAYPALPRALPAAGVGLPHTTSIAGHPRLLRSSRVAGSPPARRGHPRQPRSASTFLYSAMSRAWGMGFTTFHRMTPALSMMNVPRVATPLSTSNTP